MTLLVPGEAQRWRERRDSFRRPGEQIDPSQYGVEVVVEREAKAFGTRHHYSSGWPAARLSVGLFRSRGSFWTPELVGVCVFSVGMQPKAITRWTAQEPVHGVELGRFVLLDDVPWNGETWFLARAFRELRREIPDVRAVLSYADPVPRTMQDGTVIKPGHIGVIYKSFNGRYVGRSSPRALYLDQRGCVVSMRGLSKLRQDERGAAGAYQQLLDAGAPARRHGEDPSAYVARALREGPFRRVQHPGNHAYVWPVGRQAHQVRAVLPVALPYPEALQRDATTTGRP